MRLELIPTPANDEDHEHVEPIEQSTGFGHAPFREVIGDGTPANCALSTVMLDFGCLEADLWGSSRRGKGMTYWKPMKLCTMSSEMRAPSTMGLREPEAKGMTVRGSTPAATILFFPSYQLHANQML